MSQKGVTAVKDVPSVCFLPVVVIRKVLLLMHAASGCYEQSTLLAVFVRSVLNKRDTTRLLQASLEVPHKGSDEYLRSN